MLGLFLRLIKVDGLHSFMDFFKFDECEGYKLPQGKIFIGPCGRDLSFGFLELAPDSSLEEHSRPVDEELVQIEGESVITLFDGEETREIDLEKGDFVRIPENKSHVHGNRSSSRSLTLWKFEGDIRDVIENITDSCPKL